jgi:hypothetical protein
MQFDCVISESKLVCMWGLEKTNDPQRDETSLLPLQMATEGAPVRFGRRLLY